MRLPRDSEIALARRLLVVVGLGIPGGAAARVLPRPTIELGRGDLPVAGRARRRAVAVRPVAGARHHVPGDPRPAARGLPRAAPAVPRRRLRGGAHRVRSACGSRSSASAPSRPPSCSPEPGRPCFYGSELMPNLWVASDRRRRDRRPRPPARGSARAGTTSWSPAGSSRSRRCSGPSTPWCLTAALVLLPIAVRRATISWTVHLVLGLAAGWAPWLVEMTARFGSPRAAFAAAARLGHTGRWSAVRERRASTSRSATDRRSAPSPTRRSPSPVRSGSSGSRVLVALGLRAASRRGLLPSLVVPLPRAPPSPPSTSCSPTRRPPGSCCPRWRSSRFPPASAWHAIVAGVRERRDRPPPRRSPRSTSCSPTRRRPGSSSPPSRC